ncbi:MAG: cytochrome c oxidase subunit 3 [Pseudomonadales bacterium]|jgi:cytochrome c oxidase subunit 3|nr:cytochrome c oxidase subunit 3 [Pseudomonadales bacterium]
MSIVKTLASKPWLGGSDASDEPVLVNAFDLPVEKVGLRVFFIVATALFMLFIVGYRMRMTFADWQPLQDPLLLWFNTGMLILASVALQTAKRAAANEQIARVKQGFYAGGALSLAFIVGQLTVWSQLSADGQFVATNPASSFFYLITAVHGLHIVGGLVAWVRTLSRMRRMESSVQIRLSVDLCAEYWHYLLVVWLVLFILLLST